MGETSPPLLSPDLLSLDGPGLVFGGRYSNLEATQVLRRGAALAPAAFRWTEREAA